MIKVTLRDFGFTVTGHAGYAEQGKDIVCSAVSAVALITLNGLLWYTNVEYKVDDGHMFLDVKVDNAEAKALLHTFKQGIELIAEQYPDYVEVEHDNSEV